MSLAIDKISDSIQPEPPVKTTPGETTADSSLVQVALCFFLVGLWPTRRAKSPIPRDYRSFLQRKLLAY